MSALFQQRVQYLMRSSLNYISYSTYNTLEAYIWSFSDRLAFILTFVSAEFQLISTSSFIWKSANFADSYWFLHAEKVNLLETSVVTK